ncbi:hypothetical protein Acsp03_45160 [Actinomadura sp. NBRC 104412]|uniref:DUF2617 family protein n=1 Tax=Actinomadura sp. NBRC 104412 TaxID=3032203 RepID=UPI0024A0C899|nr:DUF2617 family protein [Actinomadura sp. NBRC 104412]GLZ07050.1 hypothetical protein Acsp03_45160 [Actinomadura sp. NBRC 104412]
MRTTLDTPYADTSAAALSFALGLPRLDALAVLALEAPDGGGVHVELRLLGASHQVLAGTFSETVACLPGEREPVPGRFRGTAGGWAYDFASVTAAHDAAGFRRAVDDLRDLLSGRDDALTGTFPGSPYAVTALVLDPAGDGGPELPGPSLEPLDHPVPAGGRALRAGWRTWHAYPQTQEIVMTRSRLVSAR